MTAPVKTPPRPAPRCPTCGKEAVARYRPFCSKRCADADLGRWFSGAYAIPAHEPPDDWPGDGRDDGEGPRETPEEP